MLLVDYALACGHIQALPTTDEMLLVDSRDISGAAYCEECTTWCGVVERVDPADTNPDTSAEAAS